MTTGDDDMVGVEVHLFAAAAAALGTETTTVAAGPLSGALAQLGERTDDVGRRVLNRSSVLVNAVACTDLDRELVAGDRLDVLPPFAGG